MTEYIPDDALPRLGKTDEGVKHDYFIDEDGKVVDESGREIIWKLSDGVKHDKERGVWYVTKRRVSPPPTTLQILRHMGGEKVELLDGQKIEEYIETIELGKTISPAFQTDPQVQNEEPSPVKKRLTREDGMTSRRKGIEGQRRCAQFLMGIVHELSDNYGQDEPDYHLMEIIGVVLAIGQHKGYTLNEMTKQRRISSKDLVSAEKDVKKYRVPMIIFVTNFTNGQIWAYLVRFEEYDGFKGITTPIELLKTDEKSQKFLMDSIISVLVKVGFDRNLVEKETKTYFSNLQPL